MTAPPVPYTVADFIADARRIVPPGGGDPGPAGRDAIGELMSRLATNPDLLARTDAPTKPGGTHGIDIRGGELHKEPDGTLTLMFARFPHEAETPIHNHNSWGIVCIVHGRDRYLAWRRNDDCAQPDRGDVSLLYEKIIGPGEFVHFGDVPHDDWHSQQGADGAPVWELVFFGRDPNTKPRLYFDPATNAISSAFARQSR